MDLYIDIFLTVVFVLHCVWRVRYLIKWQDVAQSYLLSGAAQQMVKMAMLYICITFFIGLLVDALLLWRLFYVLGGHWTSSVALLLGLLLALAMWLGFKSCFFRQVIIVAKIKGASL